RFIHRTLPWIVGGVALLVFAFTLNRWVNLRSLPIVSKVWEGTPPSQSPLFYAITYPLRFFPMALQPLLLNIFTALCGGLTIALLARSVALLPHDRTHEQRVRERSELSLLSIPFAWAPVILAAGACAFQLTFWENATAATGELFDLALFAYVIRSLLEYRISQNDSWLFKAALVYGLSIPNNWAMIGFFPLFLGAIVWIKGIRFFDPSFLIRMALLGMAGLLIYLLLPLAWTLRGQSEMSFFEILRASWLGQKLYLADIPNLRNRAFLLGLTSVLPVVVMGIRWRSSSGDISAAGASLTTLAFRVIHLFFLAACLFVCFDIKFSPRSRTASGAELGLGLPFLTFYYLGALAIGYYSGYALLVFTDPPRKGWRHDNPLAKILNPLVRFVVLVAAISVPLGLLYRNYAPIRAGDGTVLKEFTARTLEGLPTQPAYLLSEDAYQLSMLQAALAPTDRRDQYAMVNTRLLENPAYHEKLHRQYGPRWPLMGSREDLGQRVGQADLQLYVTALSVSNLVIYLHPSFGYFFERMYAEPNGQTLRLHPFHREEILPPPLTPDQLQKNEAFWRDASDYLKRIEALEEYDSLDAHYLAKYYSRALNNWGVSLQRSEKLADAGNDFARAADLNTNNIPAKFNRAFNEAVQKGRTVPSENGKGLEEKFGNYRTWDTMLGDNGPFDQPEFCQSLGEFFVNQFQYRQAALQFSRAVHFQPTNFVARIALARAYVAGQWIPRAIAELDGIDREFKELPSTNRLDIISLRAGAAFAAGDFPRAEGLLKNAVAQNPDESAASQALVELYRGAGHYTNAIAVLD
ncbi:MAG TPA: tetratricopeptide repeat protein, partial [Verrucomicrobiae bacterium]|nr:tetratricopeptide repeat protein [Verrucomicrobiae bacterium]